MNLKQLFWISLLTSVIGSAITLAVAYAIGRKQLAETVNQNPAAKLFGFSL